MNEIERAKAAKERAHKGFHDAWPDEMLREYWSVAISEANRSLNQAYANAGLFSKCT